MKAILKNSTVLLLAAISLVGRADAQISPIDVTGWNYDFVIDNPTPYDLSVTGTMDGGLGQVENWTWVEKGTYTNAAGNPQEFEGLVAGTHSSLTGNGTFKFQPFSGNNVLALDAGQNATLTLKTPAAFESIALYGASSFGSKLAKVTLFFANIHPNNDVFDVDGTGIGTDWFNTGADKALEVKGRASNRSEEGYTRLYYQQNDTIGINETFYTLKPQFKTQLLTAVKVDNKGSDRMVIFALSGHATVPGDFNGDGTTDGRDFLMWQRGESPERHSAADLAAWQANYGAASSLVLTQQAVPEPATWVLTGCAFIGLFTGRAGRRPLS